MLRVVPQADVAVTDPLFTTAWISTIHGTMIWESLFAWDSKLQAKPQMAKAWSTSPDGLTWRFTLRDGLKFHDGSPVTTADVIPSLKRWMTIDSMAKKVAAVTTAMTAIDDKTFEWTLSAPQPGLIDTLAAAPSHFAIIMRAQDIPEPGKPATSVIGSGPFKFNRELQISGARVVYDRNADYVPRDEPPDGLAGGRGGEGGPGRVRGAAGPRHRRQRAAGRRGRPCSSARHSICCRCCGRTGRSSSPC